LAAEEKLQSLETELTNIQKALDEQIAVAAKEAQKKKCFKSIESD